MYSNDSMLWPAVAFTLFVLAAIAVSLYVIFGNRKEPQDPRNKKRKL